MKDPFAHDQEEPLREVMMMPLLEQLQREARGFALTAALAVGLVSAPALLCRRPGLKDFITLVF